MKVTKRKAKGVLADMIADMDEDSLAKTREKMEKITEDYWITEDYCSQEVRQLLREKGFPVGVGSWSRGFVWYGEGYAPGLVKHENSITHQMAMKWLRDVYDIHISVDKTFLINDMDNKPYLVRVCTKKHHTSYNSWQEYHSTYEEAVEAALKYALENLI